MPISDTTDNSALLPALVHFLSWEDQEPTLLRDACTAHVRWCFQRLYQLDQAPREARLFSEVRQLPRASQQRLLLAPAVHHMLAAPVTDETRTRLAGFVQVERFLAGSTARAAGWSALGDYYHPVAAGVRGVPADDWCPENEFSADRVGGLVLDTYCEHNGSLMPQQLSDLVPHTPAELQIVRNKIEDGLSQIQDTAPLAAWMIRECVRVIRVSKFPGKPDIAFSHSHRALIGRIGFINSHQREPWTVLKIVNDLIHESVHAMIYKIELVSPLYMDYGISTVLKATSPWSNRLLNLHSFVHACFVWYALYSFWQRFADSGGEARAHREKARRGFLGGDPLTLLSPEARANVQPHVLDAISTLCGRVH